jgi:hypothetical protein
VCIAAALAGVVGCGFPKNEQGNLAASALGQTPDLPLSRVPFDAELREACGTVAVADDAFTRLPYLQQAGPDGARLLWATALEEAQRVEVTLPNGESVGRFPAEVDADGMVRAGEQRMAALEGLEPNRMYCYSIVNDDDHAPQMARVAFHTAPEPGTGGELRFVALGDSGYDGIDQPAVFDQMRSVPSDVVLHLGDLAYERGALDEIEHLFFRPYAPMLRSVPFYTVPGNHDYDTDEGAPYRAVFDLPENGGTGGRERWYSFDRGPVHFVVLDSERNLEPQVQWLEQDLGENELPWVVVAIHRPPYSSGEHGSAHGIRDLFGPIIEAHGVQLVLSGHEHDYERTVPIDGTTYVVSGGGGRGTRPVGESDFTAFSEAVAHFVQVTVDGDEMRLYAVDATGQTFDFALIQR